MHIVLIGSAPLHRPGPAADDLERSGEGDEVRAPVHPAGEGIGRYSYLDGEPPLGPRLIEVIRPDVAQGEDCLVVAGAGDRAAALQSVRFARQALRTDLVTASVQTVSPLRLAVVVDALQQMDIRGLLPGPWHLHALDQLIAQSYSMMVAHRVTRLRDPAPTFAQRWAFPSRTRLFVATDSPAGATVTRLGPGGAQLMLPVVGAGPTSVSIARGTLGLDCRQIVDTIDPVGVVTVANDPSWWRRWSSPQVSELVVTPADLDAVAARIRNEPPPSWLCSWCGTRISDLAGCRYCGADFRGVRERFVAGQTRRGHRSPDPAARNDPMRELG